MQVVNKKIGARTLNVHNNLHLTRSKTRLSFITYVILRNNKNKPWNMQKLVNIPRPSLHKSLKRNILCDLWRKVKVTVLLRYYVVENTQEYESKSQSSMNGYVPMIKVFMVAIKIIKSINSSKMYFSRMES